MITDGLLHQVPPGSPVPKTKSARRRKQLHAEEKRIKEVEAASAARGMELRVEEMKEAAFTRGATDIAALSAARFDALESKLQRIESLANEYLELCGMHDSRAQVGPRIHV